jgi:hypothetical protein
VGHKLTLWEFRYNRQKFINFGKKKKMPRSIVCSANFDFPVFVVNAYKCSLHLVENHFPVSSVYATCRHCCPDTDPNFILPIKKPVDSFACSVRGNYAPGLEQFFMYVVSFPLNANLV